MKYTKGLMFFILVFLLIIPTSGISKDNVKIICSPLGGYSLLPQSEYHISYMNPDGSVKWEKLNRVLQEIATTGASMWREFPPWITDEKQYEILTPFKFESNKEEEMVLNPRYFENLRKIARLSNQYHLTLIYDLFNASETRVKPTRSYSPWNKFQTYFYQAPEKYLKKWIDAVLDANAGLDTWYQLCNEPSFEYPGFMSFVYCYLVEQGIPPERIIIGYDMRLKALGGIYETGYRQFRKMVAAKLGQEYELKIKTLSWSPFHAASDQALTRYWGEETPTGGQRRELFSLDASWEIDEHGRAKRPNENESYQLFKRIFETKSRKVELGRIGSEVIYGKEAGIDPLAQLRGLVEAYETCLEKTPENKGKYPKPLPLPSWIEEKEEKEPPEEPELPNDSIEGISLEEIINWVKKNPWIIQLITDTPHRKKLKEALETYWHRALAWEKEKQEKQTQLTETLNTEKELNAKKHHLTAMKLEVIAWESEINTTTYLNANQLKDAKADNPALLLEHSKKDTLIDSLKLLLYKKNAIILELESAIQISGTLSQSNLLFYTREFELRNIANGILKDASDNMEQTNPLVIGIGGYYDPFKKTYGASIFVGINIKYLLSKVF